MTVRELLAALAYADLDTEVRVSAEYAHTTAAISEVVINWPGMNQSRSVEIRLEGIKQQKPTA